MTKTELLELIENGENSGVEFKRDDIRPEQLAKEVVALANFQGGKILLGVEDDGTISGLRRTDPEDWVMDTVFGRPREALREALVNALAHRDWTRVEDVEVVRYANRLEIKSPGALPNSMTVEKMLAGQRSARNPLIVEVLRDYGYVDARGMGVRTKIIPLLKQHNGTPPDLEATEDYLLVRMHRALNGIKPVG